MLNDVMFFDNIHMSFLDSVPCHSVQELDKCVTDKSIFFDKIFFLAITSEINFRGSPIEMQMLFHILSWILWLLYIVKFWLDEINP